MYDPTKPYKKQIVKLIQKTWETPYVSVRNNIVEKKFSYPEYHHSDGIGTKGIYHWRQRSFKNVVIDALAMNLNDLAVMGAKPYAIVNHLFVPQDDKEAILEIIDYLSEECQKRDIAIVGGETAIHDNMEGMELSITMLGFVESPRENKFKIGDYLIGIESNSLHSNGFTKVREIFGKENRAEFIAPTIIYSNTILSLIKKFDIHGMVHVTGGAFTKLKDLLNNTDVRIKRNHKLKPQPIFQELYQKGVSDEEMYKTFNCGIGFILSVEPEETERILSEIKNFNVDVIGEIVLGTGKVKIESSFEDKEIIF